MKGEAEAEAIKKVQQAHAEGIAYINQAQPSDEYLRLRSLEAAEKMADGQATKIIVPSDIANLAGTVAALKETVAKEEK